MLASIAGLDMLLRADGATILIVLGARLIANLNPPRGRLRTLMEAPATST